VSYSYGVLLSSGVSHEIFIANKPTTYYIFGVSVTRERWNNVWTLLHEKLAGWKPSFNNAFELYLKVGGDWRKIDASKIGGYDLSAEAPYEAWKTMPKEAIDYVRSLPEFDAKMFFEITGIGPDHKDKDEVEIIIEGEKKFISRKDAVTLGLVK